MAIFCLFFLIWIMSPYLSHYFIQQQLNTYQLTLNEQSSIRYNPFITQVTIDDLQLSKNNKTVFAIEKLTLETSIIKLLFKQLDISKFAIDGLFAKVDINDEKINVAGIEIDTSKNNTPEASSNPEAAAQTHSENNTDKVTEKNSDKNSSNAAPDYQLVMSELSLTNSRIELTLNKQPIPIILTTINVTNLSADSTHQQAHLLTDVNILNAQITLKADANLQKNLGMINSEFALINADLSSFQPWLPAEIENLLGTANLSSTAQLSLSTDNTELALTETALAVDGLSFMNQKQLIAIDNQAVNLSELNVILSEDKPLSIEGSGDLSVSNLSVKNQQHAHYVIASIRQIINEAFTISSPNFAPQLSFEHLTVDDVKISRDHSSELPALTQFNQLAINNVTVSATAAEIETITLSELMVHAEIDKNKVLANLKAINSLKANNELSATSTSSEAEAEVVKAEENIEQSPTEIDAKNTQPQTNFHLKLGSFALLNDSKIHFNDLSVKPVYERDFILSEFHFGPLDTHVPELESKLTIRGKSNEYSKITIDGIAKPFLPEPYYAVEGGITEVSLQEVSAYIKDSLNYEIKSGQLNVAIDVQLSGKKITGEKNILLRGLDFTAVDDHDVDSLKDKTAIPFAIALGMLKDSQGNVELNIPLTGSTDDPSFGISGFITLLVKQATMSAAKDYLMTTFVPYANVVSIAMTAGEMLLKVRFNDLEYPVNQFTFNEQQQEFLQQFALLMKDKPETQVTICPVSTPADIGSALGSKVTTESDIDQLTELSIKRFKTFKKEMVEQHQLESSRLLMCTPQIDSAKDAKPRLTFAT